MADRVWDANPSLKAEAEAERARHRRRHSGADEDDGRPVVRLVAGRLTESVDSLEEALIAAPAPLFRQSGRVVEPVIDLGQTASGEAVEVDRLMSPTKPRIIELMTAAARIERWDKRTEAFVRIDAPRSLAEIFLARGTWRLPLLRGLATAPLLRPDGSLLMAPGYDPDTALYLVPGGALPLSIPERPDKQAARSALERLRQAFRTFPFEDRLHETVGIAALLTGLQRPVLSTAPLIDVSAPAAGTGKSLFVDVVSTIVTGRKAAVIAQAANREETEKRFASALLAGDRLITLDNCEEAIEGPLINQAITQEFLKIRPLGGSVQVEVPTRALYFATGNNLILAGDMVRRALLLRLDAKTERPEERRFDIDAVHEALAHRAELVSAALTILRAFHLAGAPEMVAPLGGFVEWSRTIRDALIWLDAGDVCETMLRIRELDPATHHCPSSKVLRQRVR